METDFVLEAVVQSATASDAVGLCTQLLRQESTALSAVTSLLERVRMGKEEEAGVRTILQGIRGACAPPSAICDQLLQLLPMMSPPTAVVEALPYFVGGDPADARNVVKECKDLLEGDGSMLVHVVGSLHDLPLGADTRQEVSAMTLEALSVVGEEDLPVVIRTLLKTVRERDSSRVVARVRAECAGLGPTALAVLVDVLADAFSFNESVTRAFLAGLTSSVASSTTTSGESRSFFGASSSSTSAPEQSEDAEDEEEEEDEAGEEEKEEGENGEKSLSTLDVVGFLLLLPHRRHVAAVHNLLDKLSRNPERLPTDIIASLAARSGAPPWACLASPIRQLGLWAAMASPDHRARVRSSTSSASSTSMSSSSSRSSATSASSLRLLRRAGSRILLAVFRGHPNARAPIVSCCLGVVGTHRLPTRGAGVGGLVGGGGGGGACAEERYCSATDQLLETCLGALDLLLALADKCPALMLPYANTVGDLVLGGGRRTLHPRLLDKAAECLAALTRHSNSMVNELMNHVQKQVFFLGAGGNGGGGSDEAVGRALALALGFRPAATVGGFGAGGQVNRWSPTPSGGPRSFSRRT
ncbi:unnamed protein product [Pylaiella littoralis]